MILQGILSYLGYKTKNMLEAVTKCPIVPLLLNLQQAESVVQRVEGGLRGATPGLVQCTNSSDDLRSHHQLHCISSWSQLRSIHPLNHSCDPIITSIILITIKQYKITSNHSFCVLY